MNIKSGETVLNITHKDMDGVGCGIIIENTFKGKGVRVSHYPVGYPEIDSVLNTLHYENYDHVLLTDISPVRDPSLIDRSPKIHLIDHHDSALKYHNPEKFRFVNMEKCATALVKDYFEKEYATDLSYLTEFVDLVNGYDMWLHFDKRSKLLNSLYYKYWDEKFRARFMSGEVSFTEKEIEFFKEQKKKFNDIWNAIKIYEMEDIKGAFITAGEMINDVCEKVMVDEGYDFVFCLNSRSKTVSVRTTREDINIGQILERMNIGGGHAKSAGIDPRTMTELNSILEKVSDEIKKELDKNLKVEA
jgi:oligoribonuclease NrnB/cAMP/cGMP phosphodiesterase (DHH superfamily)